MRLYGAVLAMALISPLIAPAQSILLNAPIILQTPGTSGVLDGWYDGETFWVSAHALLEQLGYQIDQSDSTILVALDSRRSMTFEYTQGTITVNGAQIWNAPYFMIGSDGHPLVRIQVLESVFGDDVVWDERTLILQLSSDATLFDPHQFGQRKSLASEDPKNILFPRERKLFGGLHVGYVFTHQEDEYGRRFHATAHTVADMMGGTVRWSFSRRTSRISYDLDMQHTWLTRIQIGQINAEEVPSVRITNRPLSPKQIHREEILSGETTPHAIVRGMVSGVMTEQVQADRRGRYAVRVPIYYGSTNVSVEAEPLGAEPVIIENTSLLTPHRVLSKRSVEYEVSAGRDTYGHLSWGVLSSTTLHLSGAHKTRQGAVGITSVIAPSLYVDMQADVLDRSGTSELRWWKPWASADLRYQYRQSPLTMHTISADGVIALGHFSLHGQVIQQRIANQKASTRVASLLGWYGQNLDVRIRAQWNLSMNRLGRASADLRYRLPFQRLRSRVSTGIETRKGNDQTVHAGFHIYGKRWYSTLQGEHLSHGRGPAVSASVQINTDWAWLDARMRFQDGRVTHHQSLRGAILFGQDIRFSATARHMTQVVFRIFTDANLNGRLDPNEALSHHGRLSMSGAPVEHRTNGEVVVTALTPHTAYTVQLLPESIIDPFLYPITGHQFSFVATPGRTRYIDIALQPLPVIQGQITGWLGSPAVLRVEIIDGTDTIHLDVYHDGGFLAQLPEGSYTWRVRNVITQDVVNSGVWTIGSGENQFVIRFP